MVCEILFPILKPGARVVNVSSSCGFPGLLNNTVRCLEMFDGKNYCFEIL